MSRNFKVIIDCFMRIYLIDEGVNCSTEYRLDHLLKSVEGNAQLIFSKFDEFFDLHIKVVIVCVNYLLCK